ncbi:MAG: M28 family peptidase [Thermosphaera sp.]
MIREISDTYSKYLYQSMTEDVLSIITRYNRVQGSKELNLTVEELKEIVEGFGLPTKILKITPGGTKGYMEIPHGWNLHEGLLEIKLGSTVIEKYYSRDHPTIVAAHSPSGEGCGELTLCTTEKCEGDVVLAKGYVYDLYKNIDAQLILVYDPKRYQDAVPYTGLFIDRSEVLGKVVMNIPYTTALRLQSMIVENPTRKITICWKVKSEFNEEPITALVACNSDEPEILFTSHICHPKPGAHDNASGSVANLLIAFAIALSGKTKEVPACHAWIPEYTGTIFLKSALKNPPKAVINLDMIGSNQAVTGSTLNIVIPPLFMDSTISPYTYLAVKYVMDTAPSFSGFKLPGLKYSISPYTAGSDHDVTLAWGWDSIMLNEWPSKYYHTDMDSPSTLSISNIIRISLASLLAASLFHQKYKAEQVKSKFKEYLRVWYAIESFKSGVDLPHLEYLIESHRPLTPGDLNALETPISLRYLYKKLDKKQFLRLREIRGASTFLSVYAPLAYKSGIEKISDLFKQENLLAWTKDEEIVINEAWAIIRDELLK